MDINHHQTHDRTEGSEKVMNRILVHSYRHILSLATEADLIRIVSPEDLTKASKYVKMEDRDRFIAARILLWQVLSGSWTTNSSSALLVGDTSGIGTSYVNESYGDLSGILNPLCFEYGRNGKPGLPSCDTSFNWSHSGELVALILGNENVGVDVEEIQHRPLFEYKSLCTLAELHWLSGVVDRQRYSEIEAFIMLWTAKESVLKAIGSGLSIDPSVVEIRFTQDDSDDWESEIEDQKFFGTQRILRTNTKGYALSWCGHKRPCIIEIDKRISLYQK
jgi:phosphopantetheinyl transferase